MQRKGHIVAILLTSSFLEDFTFLDPKESYEIV